MNLNLKHLNSRTKTAQKVASNTIYQLVGKILTMSVTILATIIITKTYGRQAYGEFSLMQSWPALFFIIVDFGMNAIATRELSRDFNDAGKYIGSILLIRVVFSMVLITLLSVLLSFFPYSESLIFGIRLSLLLILTQTLFTTMNVIFQTTLNYKYSTVSLVLGYVVILFLLLFLSNRHVSVVWINFSYVIGGFITFLSALYFVYKLNIKITLKPDKKLTKYLLVQSLPLGVMFVFSQMNFKEDELLLSVLNLPHKYGLNNTESVAVYSLPYKVFEVALVFPTFFMNAVYPIMVRHMEEAPKKLIFTLKKSVLFLVFSALLAALVGYVATPFAVNFLGGSQFGESILVLRILLGGLIFYFVTQPVSWLIVTLEKQFYLPVIYLIAAAVNLILNLIFIPKYSFYGAAVITHVSELFILVMLIIAARKAYKSKYA
jgi:O-antigen/teichoic acid export membrane protein